MSGPLELRKLDREPAMTSGLSRSLMAVQLLKRRTVVMEMLGTEPRTKPPLRDVERVGLVRLRGVVAPRNSLEPCRADVTVGNICTIEETNTFFFLLHRI